MRIRTVIALVVIAITAAYLLLSRPTFDDSSTGPTFVQDSVPKEIRAPSPTLAERERRARERRTRRSAASDSEGGENSELDDIDTEFAWQTGTGVNFDDVGGMSDVKRELRQDVIVPLTEKSEEADRLGVSASNIVFFGPPGTGKTYIAEALATELELPFAELSGSDVQSKWINESTEKVSALFTEAERVAEKCDGAVVFVDEIDSVLSERSGRHAHAEDEKVVNEFLNHLGDVSDDVVFIGATNRMESLDDAGVRSGRIDKQIEIGMPGFREREEILQAQLSSRPHTVSQDVMSDVAEDSLGCSAADLAALVDAAARHALARGDDKITDEDLLSVSVD